MASFVLCARKSLKNEFQGELGPTKYLMIPEDVETPTPEHGISSPTQWMKEVVGKANPGGQPGEKALDIVVFVHGYNTDPKEALKRQRVLEAEMNTRGFPCLVIGFDWPTSGNAISYAYDRFLATETASELVKRAIIPFTKFTEVGCVINVHVLAHSMGAYVVRESFRTMDNWRSSEIANDWRVGQVVLFGADLSSSCFASDNPDMKSVFAHCGRLTNYYSGYDAALAVSNVKNIDISSRVGRVGMPVNTPCPPKAVDVDCGPAYQLATEEVLETSMEGVIDGMVSHSWYLVHEQWLNDLAMTLKGDVDRNAFPTRKIKSTEANDFVLI